MFILKKIQYNAPVILTYTILSLCVLLLGMATNGESTRYLFSVYRSPVADPLTYVRVFGHVLGHISFVHYFNNFILILLIGPILEEKYGSKTILLLIVTTALITGILNILLYKNTMLLGASGIVFMLILLSSIVNFKKGMVPLTLILVVIIFIGQELVSGFNSTDNISHLTHIVGGICGAVLGYFINQHKVTASDNRDTSKISGEEDLLTSSEDSI